MDLLKIGMGCLPLYHQSNLPLPPILERIAFCSAWPGRYRQGRQCVGRQVVGREAAYHLSLCSLPGANPKQIELSLSLHQSTHSRINHITNFLASIRYAMAYPSVNIIL